MLFDVCNLGLKGLSPLSLDRRLIHGRQCLGDFEIGGDLLDRSERVGLAASLSLDIERENQLLQRININMDDLCIDSWPSQRWDPRHITI